MKLFQCQHCSSPVFFENSACESCGHLLGFLENKLDLIALAPTLNQWSLSQENSTVFKYCANKQYQLCNWLVPIDNVSGGLCSACTLNRTIPNLGVDKNRKKWEKLEIAKHRLIFQLRQLNLPVESKRQFNERGLYFDFVSKEDVDETKDKPMTGHANGVITILVSEADSVLREQMKMKMSEKYRTLIGHFRHEVGHYYWDRLIRNNHNLLHNFRTVFGDERESYADALDRYYNNGPPNNWRNSFISEYASSHPWEDWAETWAHYLHLMDTTETAYFYGIGVNPRLSSDNSLEMNAVFDPYQEQDFKRVVDLCIPLFSALNSVNRSMGIPDVYPFVISTPVIDKMTFIHNVLQSYR